MVEFLLTIIRTDGEALTNPYLKAKALELLSLIVYCDVKKELSGDFVKSPVISMNLMQTLTSFYVDIEFSGHSHAFYDKFKYRYQCT